MHTIIGNLTTDAKIYETKDGRKVVHFTIAENHRFKTKASDTIHEKTNFYNCSYWMGTGVTKLLTKGSLIEACGRIGLNVYNNLKGEAVGSLIMHVNFIKPHGKSKTSVVHPPEGQKNNTTEAKDDLPF